MVIYSRKISKSKEGKYTYTQLTFPSELIENLGWESGDKLIFYLTGSGVIVTTNISKIKDKQPLEYNKKWGRRLVKKGQSLGFRFSTHPVFDELKYAAGDNTYFLNGKDSIQPSIDVLISFNKQILEDLIVKERYYLPKDIKKMYRETVKKKMPKPPGIYRYQDDVIESNSDWTKRRAVKANQFFNKQRRISITTDLKKFKKWAKELPKGNHPKKKEILAYYKERIAELKKELEKDVKIFTEFETKKKKVGWKKASSNKSAKFLIKRTEKKIAPPGLP